MLSCCEHRLAFQQLHPLNLLGNETLYNFYQLNILVALIVILPISKIKTWGVAKSVIKCARVQNSAMQYRKVQIV